MKAELQQLSGLTGQDLSATYNKLLGCEVGGGGVEPEF